MPHRWQLGFVLLTALGLIAVADGRQRSISSKPSKRLVIVWSERSIIGPIYFPASEEEDSPVRLAAEDFGRILGKMSGHAWPVLPEPSGQVSDNGIFVGRTIRAKIDGVGAADPYRPATTPKSEAIVDAERWDRTEVRIRPDRLVINGTTPEATRAGLYRFLSEETDAMWVQPGPHGEALPSLPRFSLRQGDRVYTPDFLDRRFLLGGRLNADRSDDQWAIRNSASRHLEFNHNLFRVFTPEAMAAEVEWRGERFGEVPAPEAFSAVGHHPDFLNPEVVGATVDHISARMRAFPNQLSFSLGTNDSTFYDHSQRTQDFLMPWEYYRGKPNYSKLVFSFSDAVAQGIETASEDAAIGNRFDPPAYLTQLAYMWAEQPPDFSLNPRIMPYLCSDRSQWYDPDFRKEDMELVKAWSLAGPEILGTWEYYQGQPYLIPRYFPTIEKESLAWFYKHKGRGVFFSGKPAWGYDAPKYWLAGQLGWDISQDHRELLDHYFSRAYGPTSEFMARFFALCESAWMNQPGKAVWLKYWNNPDQFALFPRALRDEISQLLDDAISQATTISDESMRETISARIDVTRRAWAVTTAAADLYDAWCAIPYLEWGDLFSAEVPTEALADFDKARKAWMAVDKTPFPHAKTLIKIMGQLDPAARWEDTRSPAKWQAAFREDFEREVVENDLHGVGPEEIPPNTFRNGWIMYSLHAEDFSFRRLPNGPEGPSRIRVAGADNVNLFRWFDFDANLSGDFRVTAWVRGQISPGSKVNLRLLYMNEDQKLIEPTRRDRLFPGEFPSWIQLSAMSTLPEDASRIGVGLRIVEQFEGDWLEVSTIMLQFDESSDSVDARSEY
ncbi:MAG: DUF4838 domain-containing protein [Verrucomicrobiota bacterium]